MPSSRTRRQLLQGVAIAALGAVAFKLTGFPALAGAGANPDNNGPSAGPAGPRQLPHSAADWRRLLTPPQYDVLRRPSRPPVRRRAAPDRPALLHERRRPRLPSGARRAAAAARRLAREIGP